MKNARVLAPLLFVALCGALVAGWIGLFQPRLAAASPAPQGPPEALLMRIKELDASWSTEVLKTQIEINRSYDPLVAPFLELIELRQQLIGLNEEVQSPVVAAAIEDLSRAIDEKAILVDRYKSTHSLLKNSMRYIPTVHRDMRSLLPDAAARPAQARGGSSVAELIADLLRYNAAPEPEVASSISLRVSMLRDDALALPDGQKEQMLNLLSHIRTVVNERPRVYDALDRIMRIPVAGQADKLREMVVGQTLGRAASSQSSRDAWMAGYALAAAAIVGLGVALMAKTRSGR